MEPVIIVEILDRRGRLLERVRAAHLPLTIGRGWDSDVLVDDPHVSAAHARLSRDEAGELVLDDLGSANGTWEPHSRRRITRIAVRGDASFRVGHTTLRFRDASAPLPAALPEDGASTAARLLASPMGCTGVCLAAAALFAADSYLETYQRFAVGTLVVSVATVMAGVLLWSGGWALVSRLLSHRFRFAQHCAAAALWVFAFAMLVHVREYYAFAFGAETSARVLGWAGTFAIIGGALYTHLRLSSTAPPTWLALGAGAASTALIGLAALIAFAPQWDPDAWVPAPTFSAELKPPIARLAPSLPADDFFARVRALKDRVDAGTK